jgi:hypothetical protein
VRLFRNNFTTPILEEDDERGVPVWLNYQRPTPAYNTTKHDRTKWRLSNTQNLASSEKNYLQSAADGNIESCFKAARSAFVRLAGKEYSLLARGNAGVAGLQERGSP